MLKSVNPFRRLNREMKIFLVKLIIFIISWEALYIFLLKPKRIPDRLLTEWLAACVAWSLNTFFRYFPPITWVKAPQQDACLLQHYGRTALVIFDDCNGLDLFIIYLAFIVLLPYPVKRKIIFGLGGLVAIFIGNIFRCVSLYWVYMHFRGMFDFNHHYVFTIIMYLIIFYGWVLFTKNLKTMKSVKMFLLFMLALYIGIFALDYIKGYIYPATNPHHALFVWLKTFFLVAGGTFIMYITLEKRVFKTFISIYTCLWIIYFIIKWITKFSEPTEYHFSANKLMLFYLNITQLITPFPFFFFRVLNRVFNDGRLKEKLGIKTDDMVKE